jgi:hypothetical protein
MQKGSEPSRLLVERVRNVSEYIPNQEVTRSERVPNSSEPFVVSTPASPEFVQKGSEAVRNASEHAAPASEEVPKQGTNLPNDSERVRNETISITKSDTSADGASPAREPNQPHRNEQEPARTAPLCSSEHDHCTITVREAARIFEEAGVTRTERAITNWCNRNARGITRLECCYNPTERKYYISAESIHRVIGQERKKLQYIEYKEGSLRSPDGDDLSAQVRKERTDAERGSEPRAHDKEPNAPTQEPVNPGNNSTATNESPAQAKGAVENEEANPTGEPSSDTERNKIKELELENYNLKVQLEGQKYLVRKFDSLVEGERERHEREKLALVDRLSDARARIGGLEEKLLQLEEPNPRTREAEVEISTEDAANEERLDSVHSAF